MPLELKDYISIEPATIKQLKDSIIVFSNAPELVIKTTDASDAVVLSKIPNRLEEQGWQNYKFVGSNDGWCFLTIQFSPKKSLRI